MNTKIKVFKVNDKDKIEFTREELQQLLQETFNEGFEEGERNANAKLWNYSPSITNITPLSTTTLENYTNPIDELIGSASSAATSHITGRITGTNESTNETTDVYAGLRRELETK